MSTLARPDHERPPVPLRYQVAKPALIGREAEYVADAVASGWISGAGPYVDRFERGVSEFFGLDGGLAVSSGTAAVHLALLAAGCQPGDEVIVPAMTFVACANTIRYCGAVPVFADCDPTTWNVTAESLEAVWTERCKGVLLVHLFGRPAPADAIAELCRARGMWLVEDCAQSMGATLHGRPTGTFGDAAAVSFYGNKVISTGEGGMVFVRDPERRALARSLRAQGTVPERHHWHPVVGFNYRMPNTAAAIGCAQLERVDEHVAARRRICARYAEHLASWAERGVIRLPVVSAEIESVFWHATFVLERGGRAVRDRLCEAARRDHGIQTRPFFVPLHHVPAHAQDVELPVAEHLGDHGVMLPTYTELSDADVDTIARVITTLLAELA